MAWERPTMDLLSPSEMLELQLRRFEASTQRLADSVRAITGQDDAWGFVCQTCIQTTVHMHAVPVGERPSW